MSKNNNFLSNKDLKGNPITGKAKVEEDIDIFKCPVCGNSMHIDGGKSMVCLNKHCFDISKNGYVNLLLNSQKSKYDKEMFKSRKFICELGFFNPLIESIVLLLKKNISNNNFDYIKVLDAGCGQGFHLYQIMRGLHKRMSDNILGVGIDISKEGIRIASKNYKNIIWCVADLAKIPFRNQQFDVILNILSPSNYTEFNRIIRNDGILIKVVPGDSYLKELREVFYQDTDKEVYSNNEVIKHFSKNFKIIGIQNVQYDIAINKEEIKHVIKMTPLSWRATNEKIQEAFNRGIDSLTADFSIVVGKPRL
jgi:23S rRNA (guanine745-N1)-methyltransferase